MTKCGELKGNLKVLELCSGVGTACFSAKRLLGRDRVESVGLYDSDAQLRPLLIQLHGEADSDQWHLGPVKGNILGKPPDSFPNCHLLVAGPPCPPWSAKGSRGSFHDARSHVMWSVIDVIVRKASQTALIMFIMENVVGITRGPNADGDTPAAIITKKLRESCPGWRVDLHILNAKDFGLPQSRGRVYWVGHRVASFGVSPSSPVPFKSVVAAGKMLNWTDNGQHKYTALQDANILDFKSAMKSCMENVSRKGQVAICDPTRTPCGRTKWGSSRPTPDVCECLTASGTALHVFALGHGSTGKLPIDRPVKVSERAAFQGFPSGWAENTDWAVLKRAVGNAMAVSVVGSVIGSLIVAFVQDESDTGVQTCMAGPGQFGASSSSDGLHLFM